MGRPTKRKLDYFPLDCEMDDSIEYIEAECGLMGFAIIIKLFQRVYGDKGFYTTWDDKKAALFCKREGCSAELLQKVMGLSFEEGIFDSDMYSEYGILTSRGIQKRFFAIAKELRRGETLEEYESFYLFSYQKNAKKTKTSESLENREVEALSDENDEEFLRGKTGVFTEKTPVNSVKSAQKKRKEMKGNEKKRKEIKTRACAREEKPTTELPNLGNERLNNAFKEFAEYRKADTKHPLTERSIALAVKKLKELAPDGQDGINADMAISIIEQSMLNGYRGLFPVKNYQSRARSPNDNQSLYDAYMGHGEPGSIEASDIYKAYMKEGEWHEFK